LPVLSNVLLTTEDGRLKLSATNLEIVITCWIGAKVEDEGSITVPARTLSDLVNTLPQERVDLQLDASTLTLHVSCARTEANIKGIAAEEFPVVPEPGNDTRHQIESVALKKMISQVAFAAATDDTRPTLTGVLTRIDNNELAMAFEVIIPARALNELARIVDDSVEDVYIEMPQGRNQVIFDMDSVVLVTQLVEGNFPDYRPVIPERWSTRTVLNAGDFAQACKVAEIFARESSHTARVRVEPGNELMPGYASITATSAETGDNVAQIDATVEGEEVEIAFNVRYMSQVLGVLDSPQVVLETTRATEPGVLKAMGDEKFLHIIMPMHFGR
jgi:DNA polymerase-3 subunit beta